MLISALIELLSLQNELFRITFYWTYIVCIPGIALLALSFLNVGLPSWRFLFVPASLLCFLMPFMCWRERSLSEGLHLYLCCQLLFVALFWLLFTVIGILRKLAPEKKSLKWLRQFVLYAMLVPSCALISANFGTTVREKGLSIMSSGFWIILSRTNLGMAPLRYFMVAATILVAAFCLVPHGKADDIEISEN